MDVFRKGRLLEAEIIQWLQDLRTQAYALETNFAVTSVFQARVHGTDDYYFAGVNVESIDHRIGTHAEEGSIAAIVTSLGRQAEIVEGWVMGAPKDVHPHDQKPSVDTLITCCGKCRQQIVNLADASVKIHSVTLRGQVAKTMTVGEFLPGVYSYRMLYADGGDFSKSGGMAAAPSAGEVKQKLMRQGHLSEKEIFDWLKNVESVDYTSKISQSVILKLKNGFYVAGSRVEEVASISINAVQSALASAVAAFGKMAVEEVWVYTKGSDGKQLPKDSFAALTLPAVQMLLPFAATADMPLNFFKEDGISARILLSGAMKVAPTSEHPFFKK